MGRDAITPFGNDAEAQTIGDLTIENGTARIVLHGSLELTRDRAGLARARALKRAVDAIVRALAAEDLPQAVDDPPVPPQTMKNPFA